VSTNQRPALPRQVVNGNFKRNVSWLKVFRDTNETLQRHNPQHFWRGFPGRINFTRRWCNKMKYPTMIWRGPGEFCRRLATKILVGAWLRRLQHRRIIPIMVKRLFSPTCDAPPRATPRQRLFRPRLGLALRVEGLRCKVWGVEFISFAKWVGFGNSRLGGGELEFGVSGLGSGVTGQTGRGWRVR